MKSPECQEHQEKTKLLRNYPASENPNLKRNKSKASSRGYKRNGAPEGARPVSYQNQKKQTQYKQKISVVTESFNKKTFTKEFPSFDDTK